MAEYIFELGRDKELSLAELYSYFTARKIKYNFIGQDKNIAVFDLPKLDFKKVIKDLGGTVKIGEVKEVSKLEYKGSKNKIRYGLDVYKGEDKWVLDELKQIFKQDKLRATRVKQKFSGNIMPSKSVNLDYEVMLYEDKVAEVIAVFDPREYKRRDQRPVLDPLRVSSIRLSKILINLSQAKEGDRLVDPFCGVGTIIQEAVLMGMKVAGIEKDNKSVKDARENLKWIGKHGWTIMRGDALELSKSVNKVDAVATEPYLGPFLKKLPSVRSSKKTMDELKEMYSTFLDELSKVLEGKAAIIVPRFRTRGKKQITMNFGELIENKGFKVVSLENVEFPIIYYPEKAKLIREIWVIEKA